MADALKAVQRQTGNTDAMACQPLMMPWHAQLPRNQQRQLQVMNKAHHSYHDIYAVIGSHAV
jgi:hypothetical protein